MASSLIISAHTGHFLVDVVVEEFPSTELSFLNFSACGLATCAGTSPLDLQIGQTLGEPDLRQIEYIIPGAR
jgi:hypothetical protein